MVAKQTCGYLLSIYLTPEGNTITVVLHSTTSTCIPIAYSLLNNCPERPIAYTLYKPPTHCFYSPVFPHIACNALYSPQNALYWLFVFSRYNFPSICQKTITAQFCRQNENGSLTADTPLHTRSITVVYPLTKNSRPRSNGRLYLFLYYYLSITA